MVNQRRLSSMSARDCRTCAVALFAAPLLALLSACATPSVKARSNESPAPVLAANGALSEVRSERLIDSRLKTGAKKGAVENADHVRELIDEFRNQADAPLVAGNRITLLI